MEPDRPSSRLDAANSEGGDTVHINVDEDDAVNPAANHPGSYRSDDDDDDDDEFHNRTTQEEVVSQATQELRDTVAELIRERSEAYGIQHQKHVLKALRANRKSLQQAVMRDAQTRDSWPCLPIPSTARPGQGGFPKQQTTAGGSLRAAGPVLSINRPVPAAPLSRAKANSTADNYVQGRTVHLQSWKLPMHQGIPMYKSWTQLKGNILALDVGQRMFYIDEETGETLPFHDEESGHDSTELADARVLDGLLRESTNAVLLDVVHELSDAPEVINALAYNLYVSRDAVRKRVNVLLGRRSREPAPAWEERAETFDLLEADFHGAFCRMCRTYGCRIHDGAHPQPRQGPIRETGTGRRPMSVVGFGRNEATETEDSAQPCGTACYLLLKNHTASAAGADDAGAGAAGDVDQTAPMEPSQPHVKNEDSDIAENLQRHRDTSVLEPSPSVPPSAAEPRPVDSAPSIEIIEVIPPPGERAGGSAQQTPHDADEVTSPSKRKNSNNTSPSGILPCMQAALAAAPFPGASGESSESARKKAGALREAIGAEAAAQPLRFVPGVAAAPEPIDVERTDVHKEDMDKDAPMNDDEVWSGWELSALASGLDMWGHQPCKIATLIGTRTCAEVDSQLRGGAETPSQGVALKGAGKEGSDDDADEEEKRRRRRRKGGGARKKAPAEMERCKRGAEEVTWTEYRPCGCEGPCKKETCECASNANFCEKFCACDPAGCGNRFKGCNCKCGVAERKMCSTRMCPCVAAARECDPDLCKRCGDTLTGNHEPGWQCNNFRIRLGARKRVLMGRSDVAGWGAFLKESAAKDDFVGEYCGELVTDTEADRRGRVYDKEDNSYLFNLNQQWVVDAKLKGNKLRFANHSEAANCRAEVIMVDGTHRLAIVADKDIKPGDELFYDYKYEATVAPEWANRRRRPPSAGSGGRGSGASRGR